MVKFEPTAGLRIFPVNAKGGYYARILYPCKVLCFCNHKMNPSERYELDKIVDQTVVPVKSILRKDYPR